MQSARRSLRALEWSNFFTADVQTGLGPFLAAYLASAGWTEDHIGYVLTLAGLVTVACQVPAGAIVDGARHKRIVFLCGCAALAAGAVLLATSHRGWIVSLAQVLIGSAGAFLAPTLAAITMGIVGTQGFDRQFGRNQSFNSGGNLAAAALIAAVSHAFGNRAIFITAGLLILPTVACILAIRGSDIDYERSRGAGSADGTARLRDLFRQRPLLIFLVCAFLFHFANAAMLPQLGEKLAHGHTRAAAPFMAACVAVTQVVIMLSAVGIGALAHRRGRKPLLLVGFGVLPLRAVLYTVISGTFPLIAVQILDGVANAIFGVTALLVIADLTRGTGRFNLASGTLAAAVGLGAALSTSLGGFLVHHESFNISFLALGTVALAATALLAVAMPETWKAA